MNSTTVLAEVIVDQLILNGVREVVVAPGSRNAPITMAFFRAHQAGRVRLHSRIDERSAAFLALGISKASNLPAVVICTSGSAAANFHPAILEAHHSDINLIAITADRPARLRHTGANQTTNQVSIFGDAVNLLDVGKLKKMCRAKKISIKPLSFVREFTESEWSYFLRPSSLGIRLGVGFNGESSGIVRDFLTAGMSVITNEKIEKLSSYSKYFHVSDDVDARQITNSVQSALIRTQKLISVDDLNDYRLESLADYKDVLSEIKKDFYNGH